MICPSCGKELSDGTKFCGYCGKTIPTGEAAGKVCPSCGQTAGPDQVYCANCGALLVAQAAQIKAPEPAPQPHASQPARSTGVVLKRITMSLYEGEPTVAPSKATGSLVVYDDRIEFDKKWGNSALTSLGLIGVAAAAKKVRQNPVETYYFRDIVAARVGKYMGVYNTLVLQLSSGRTISFAPALPGSGEPQEILSIIRLYQPGI